MLLTLEELKAANERKVQFGSLKFYLSRSYDEKGQNTFWKNVSDKHKNEESISCENYQSFCRDLLAVEEDDYNQAIVLAKQDDVLKIIHHPVAISKVVKSCH